MSAHDPEPWQAALCGSLSGGLTGILTTPFDVLKTRIMLSSPHDPHFISSTPWHGIQQLWREGGLRRVFAGAGPRMIWISAGGFVFFGAYEEITSLHLHKNK